jgi:hypothetical protein
MAVSVGSTSTAALTPAPAPADLLDTLPPWPWSIDDRHGQRTLGWHAIAWAEGGIDCLDFPDRFGGLIQPNGPRARQRFRFTDRQRQFLLWWYAVDDDGWWLFQHGARRLAKGSGKSPFAGAFALIEFCAPVRLERFDDRIPGGCRGRPVDMPLVQIAATAESQTANTMRMVRAFAPKGSEIVKHYDLDPGKTRYYKLPEGTLEVITSSVTASEGAESSAIVADETEHWKPSNSGPALASTLIDNLAKSGSRMIETSNAWVPAEGTVAEDTWDAWVAQEEDRTRGDTRLLYDAVIAPPDTDMADPDSLRSALEWVYRDCWWQDLRPIMERIWSPKSSPLESARKYLNRPSAANDAWLSSEEWAVRADPTRVVVPGEEITLGFDGSRRRAKGVTDATALIACRVSDGHVFQPLERSVWEQPPNWPRHVEWSVPVAEVDAAVDECFRRYRVLGFFADPAKWETWVARWESKYGKNLVVKSTQGHPIEWWFTGGRSAQIVQAIAEFHDAVLDGDEFTHDGSYTLTRHVLNARQRMTHSGVQIAKEHPDSAKKIDAAIAAVLARRARRAVIATARRPAPYVPKRIR